MLVDELNKWSLKFWLWFKLKFSSFLPSRREMGQGLRIYNVIGFIIKADRKYILKCIILNTDRSKSGFISGASVLFYKNGSLKWIKRISLEKYYRKLCLQMKVLILIIMLALKSASVWYMINFYIQRVKCWYYKYEVLFVDNVMRFHKFSHKHLFCYFYNN